MTENPTCCTADTPLDQVAMLMREHDCGEIPVIDPAEQPIGVVTDRDIVRRVVAEGKNPMAYPAGICMSQPVATVSMDAPLGEVMATMEQHQVRRVPVVDKLGRCVGMISLCSSSFILFQGARLSDRDRERRNVDLTYPGGA
jgi:CBS domain-containing protein